LTTAEARKFIARLAEAGVPVLLFSGGEPVARRDIFELNRLAKRLGMATVLSTNGTLMTSETARKVRDQGFDYVGVSLDGIGDVHDWFRGRAHAFDLALAGIRNCIKAGQKTGLRFTLTRYNFRDLNDIFTLIEAEGIARACFYHLVYSGRGADIARHDLAAEEKRQVLDRLCAWVESLRDRGLRKEILTVDNHADGVYLYLRERQSDPGRAARIYQLLERSGGNASGIRIADVDPAGFVHADQFWQDVSFGNVLEKPFRDIWSGRDHDLLARLKDRKPFLKGRCARCRFLNICNGNSRVRAAAVYGDLWREDPACYLTDAEVLAPEEPAALPAGRKDAA
jgi:radical SAM protein with 4Fe4S-binding SPASM domain